MKNTPIENPKPNRAVFVEGRGGYGNRLFLPAQMTYWEEKSTGDLEKSRQAHSLLKMLCCWGGHDKTWIIDGVEHLGYEFPLRSWNKIAPQLEADGIIFSMFTEKMDVIVR